MPHDFYSSHPYPLHGDHDRIYERQLKGIFDDFDPRTILDAGCGTGVMSRSLAEHFPQAKVVAVDRSEAAIRIARERHGGIPNLSFKAVDLERQAPGDDDVFDFVFCQGVLHHMRDPERALRNLYRVSAPDMTGYVWLYSEYGRLEIAMIRRLLALVAADAAPTEERSTWLRLLRPRFRELYEEEEGQLARWRSDSPDWSVDDERTMRETDRYFNPIADHYSVDAAGELLRKACFDIVSVPTLDQAPLDQELRQRLAAAIADPLAYYGALELIIRPRGIGYLIRKGLDSATTTEGVR